MVRKHTTSRNTYRLWNLEFIEMKEVFKDVNQKMIDRTVDWLSADEMEKEALIEVTRDMTVLPAHQMM